ncbi:hypothetical protein [Zooshikella sp. RANM57]|uniref:COG4648 family protein n=1 Tax=Zooshikella sp. RANM57 TaxID=3425863 RepID=UPI003D6EFF05
MKQKLGLLFGVILFIYPLWVYWGINHLNPRWIAFILCVFFIIRLWCIRNVLTKAMKTQLWLASVIGIVITGSSALTANEQLLRFYPVIVSGGFFCWFALSLWFPPTVIEMFARLKKPDLSEYAVRYTRHVTLWWCLFFMMNGAVATWSAVEGSLAFWTIYNGSVSYVIMGIWFAIEWCFRKCVIEPRDNL